jgi:uncharacterized protein YcnI
MRRLVTVGILLLATPILVFAHVSVRPRESKPNAEERYTVRVPTEGAVATRHLILDTGWRGGARGAAARRCHV